MNKQAVAVFAVVIISLFAVEATFFSSSTHVQRYESGLNLCPTCISFSEQAINNLLNIILNAGVVGGCSEICGLLANKTGSSTLGSVCDILCDIVGVREFANLIQKADLDPIYLCELLTACKVNDNGDAKFTNLTVTPASGPVGTEFTIEVEYTSKNGTGTGEMVVGVETVDGIPIANSFLLQPQMAGKYESSIKLSASPDPKCDPTQQPCEEWLPGNYTVSIALCNGECGSKHPHSQIYDQKKVMFQLTEKH